MYFCRVMNHTQLPNDLDSLDEIKAWIFHKSPNVLGAIEGSHVEFIAASGKEYSMQLVNCIWGSACGVDAKS